VESMYGKRLLNEWGSGDSEIRRSGGGVEDCRTLQLSHTRVCDGSERLEVFRKCSRYLCNRQSDCG